MAGQIKQLIDKIVDARAKGNKVVEGSIKAKLCLKGIIVNKYTEFSQDDPVIIEKIRVIAKEFDVKL